MTTWNPRANELFLKALELRSPGERQQYLDGICAEDAALRAEVEALLDASARAGSFLESPAANCPAPLGGVGPGVRGLATTDEPLTERPGTMIGPYKLLEQIGEGGFGVVFLAEQTQPVRRKVALKVLKPGMDTRQVVARFEAERQALAIMDHPHIAKVFDGGATPSGRPYFVMELVQGVPITDFCDQNRLTPRQRLELFIAVCQAIQHAHQKGIIHRDLKPSNVLVAPYDGRPLVKVIDFGVAKAAGQPLTEETVVTGFGALVGTPEYMSPEQAELNNQDIDTRSDIYSLGVLLYELLTGTTPLTRKRVKETALLEVLRLVREEEPPRPSTRLSESKESLPAIAAQRQTEPAKLTRLVRGELDWIVVKALEKDRNRRYESANTFALDVQRYLADEPVQACPPSAGYRLRKLARRYKAALVTGTVVALALFVAAGALVVSNIRIRGESAERAKALEAATASQREAQESLKDALGAVDQFLTRVSEEKLFNTPQMEPLRKALLEDALKFYQRFLRQAGSDPAVRLGTGEAYRRTGQIYRQLGQPDQAELAYREAIALLEKLVADSPADPANRLALALSHHGLGDALGGLGRFPESESALRRAIGLMQRLRADDPKHDGYPRIMATMNVDLAWVSERLIQVAGQPKTEAFYREDLQLKKKLLAAAPNDPHRRHAVACAQVKLGSSLEHSRPQEAERLLRDAIAGNKELTSEFPHTTQYRTDLADTSHGLFRLLRAGRRFEEAEAVYRDSLPQVEQLIAQAPTLPFPRRLLVEHHWDYALMLEAAGRPQDADQSLRQAIAAAEAMWTDFPTYPWTPARLAMLHNYVGKKHQTGSRFPEAEAAFRKALAVSEKAVRAFPQMELRCRLADSCFCLGLLLWGRERHKEAESVLRKLFEPGLISAEGCKDVAWRLATDAGHPLPPEIAVEFARKAVELAPTDGAAWNTLGVAQLRARNWKESINALQKSMDLRKGGDSFNWFFLAMAHWHLGNKDEARIWYGRAVEWMDRNKPDDEELPLFRAEAAELLGIEKKKN